MEAVNKIRHSNPNRYDLSWSEFICLLRKVFHPNWVMSKLRPVVGWAVLGVELVTSVVERVVVVVVVELVVAVTVLGKGIVGSMVADLIPNLIFSRHL